MRSTEEDHFHVAELLCQHGADVAGVRGRFNLSPLLCASSDGHPESAQLHLSHGADADTQGMLGFPPLHWAATSGHLDVAWMLLEHSADANVRDQNGQTPLHRASVSGQPDKVRSSHLRVGERTWQDHTITVRTSRAESEGES